MALEGILEKIAKISDEKIAAAKEQGLLKRREILSDAELRAKQLGERILKEANEKVELEKRRSSVSAQLEYRREILREKQRLVQSCFQNALDELLNLPTDEYRALMRKMLLNQVAAGDEQVFISPQDEKRIDQKFLDGVNGELSKAGRIGRLKLGGGLPNLRGGFVLRTEEVEIDCSFKVLLEHLKDDLQSEVAGILFGEAK
jgi:V/A-type H+-transporting ATPase subunit E